jgi:hypothetical protein
MVAPPRSRLFSRVNGDLRPRARGATQRMGTSEAASTLPSHECASAGADGCLVGLEHSPPKSAVAPERTGVS